MTQDLHPLRRYLRIASGCEPRPATATSGAYAEAQACCRKLLRKRAAGRRCGRRPRQRGGLAGLADTPVGPAVVSPTLYRRVAKSFAACLASVRHPGEVANFRLTNDRAVRTCTFAAMPARRRPCFARQPLPSGDRVRLWTATRQRSILRLSFPVLRFQQHRPEQRFGAGIRKGAAESGRPVRIGPHRGAGIVLANRGRANIRR